MDEQLDQNKIPTPSQSEPQSPPPGAHTPQGAPSSIGKLDDLEVNVAELARRLKDARYAHQAEFPDFYKLLAFPDTVPINLVDECLTKLQAESLITGGNGGWRFFEPKSDKGSVLYEPLARALNIICQIFSEAVLPASPPNFNGTQHPRQYDHRYQVFDTNKSHLRDAPASLVCHPDLCLMVSSAELGAASHHKWQHVIFPIEIKPNDNRTPLIQSAAQTMALMSSQDCRLFSYSMTITYLQFTVYLWDRSGFLSSQSSDLRTNEGVMQLIQVFGRFSQMTLEEHGFDPTTFSIPKTLLPSSALSCLPPFVRPIYVRHGDENFLLDNRITPNSSIFGKETRCWTATKCNISKTSVVLDSAAAKFLIKDSWLHDDLGAGAYTTPSAQPTRSARRNPFIDDVVVTKEWSDVGLAIAEDKPLELVVDNGYEAGLYRYLERKGHIPGLARFHGGKKLKSTFQDVRRSNGPGQELSRTHHRVILNTVGQQLRYASSPQRLLMAVRDIVDAHEGLCRRNILHRDISDTNCLMDPDTETGFLTDLDHAIDITRLEHDIARSCRHRTGTLAFMGVGLLLTDVEPHNWTHDYESIYWMLLWICVGSPCEGELAPNTLNFDVLKIFLNHEADRAPQAKHFFLYTPLSPLGDTHPYFQPLNGCLSDLKNIFYEHRLASTDPDKKSLTRTAFRSVLTKWIDELVGQPFNLEAQDALQQDDSRYHPVMTSGVRYIPTVSRSKVSLAASEASSRASTKRKAGIEQGSEDLDGKWVKADGVN